MRKMLSTAANIRVGARVSPPAENPRRAGVDRRFDALPTVGRCCGWGHPRSVAISPPLQMKTSLYLLSLLLCSALFAPAAEWQPAQAPLMTRWAKDVKPYET